MDLDLNYLPFQSPGYTETLPNLNGYKKLTNKTTIFSYIKSLLSSTNRSRIKEWINVEKKEHRQRTIADLLLVHVPSGVERSKSRYQILIVVRLQTPGYSKSRKESFKKRVKKKERFIIKFFKLFSCYFLLSKRV